MAAFVVFHVAAQCVDVLPNLAVALDRGAWRDPRVERELDVWAARLGTDRLTLEPRLHALAVGAHDVRTALRAPFAPYMEATGAAQSWLMFSAGTRESVRFGVHVRVCPTEGCTWQLAYLHGDPEHAWRAGQLGHPRVRSEIFRWGWPSYAGRYERGCRTLARLAFTDFEDAQAVRCGFEWSVLPSPDAPTPPSPVWRSERVVER